MGVVARANGRLRRLGYRRGEASVISVSDDPDWLLLDGTRVRRTTARKHEIATVLDALAARRRAAQALPGAAPPD